MRTLDSDLQKLVGTLFPVISAGLLVAAAIAAISTARFIQMASRAEGKVVRLNAGGTHPVIQFAPAGEAAVEFSGNGLINYSVNDEVTVLYLKDAQSPSGFQVNIDTPGALWFTPIILSGIGVGFIIGGLYTKRLHQSR